MAKIIASMQEVVVRYGAHIALDHMNFEIGEGEIVGLLGPNGAGKTTLIQTLLGIQPCDRGRITMFGDAKQPFSNRNKMKIGLVTQEIALFEELTARENLLFFAGVYGLRGEEKRERVDQALTFVGLKEHGGRLPGKFSGGMKRRLNIACALTHRPQLLVMDEPTVGIDPQSRNHIMQAVLQLRDQGTTILYTTHYMEEVEALASRVVIMDQGHEIRQGSVESLIRLVQHEERVVLEVADPQALSVTQIEEVAGVVQASTSGNRITIISRVGSANLDRLLSLVSAQAGIVSIQAERPNLEDVFLTLTGKQLRDKGDT